MAQLRSLRLRLEGADFADYVETGWLPCAFVPGLAGLAGLLAKASPNLETLAICQPETGIYSDSRTSKAGTLFKRCIQDNTFPKLRRLALGSIAIAFEDLRAFVSRHQTTLRHVSFVECMLMEDAASKVLLVSSAQVSSLRMIALRPLTATQDGDCQDPVDFRTMRVRHGLDYPMVTWDEEYDAGGFL